MPCCEPKTRGWTQTASLRIRCRQAWHAVGIVRHQRSCSSIKFWRFKTNGDAEKGGHSNQTGKFLFSLAVSASLSPLPLAEQESVSRGDNRQKQKNGLFASYWLLKFSQFQRPCGQRSARKWERNLSNVWIPLVQEIMFLCYVRKEFDDGGPEQREGSCCNRFFKNVFELVIHVGLQQVLHRQMDSPVFCQTFFFFFVKPLSTTWSARYELGDYFFEGNWGSGEYTPRSSLHWRRKLDWISTFEGNGVCSGVAPFLCTRAC